MLYWPMHPLLHVWEIEILDLEDIESNCHHLFFLFFSFFNNELFKINFLMVNYPAEYV